MWNLCGVARLRDGGPVDIVVLIQLARLAVGNFDANRALVRGSGSDAWVAEEQETNGFSRHHGVANKN